MAETQVFETVPDRGYFIRAFYLGDPSPNARVELWMLRQNNLAPLKVSEMEIPAYKVWNYHAHAPELIDAWLEECERQEQLARSWNPPFAYNGD